MDHELRKIAARVMWWASPEVALARVDDFLCRVMVFGGFADAQYVEAAYGTERLRQAVRSAPPGVFDARSWCYWHLRLGLEVEPRPVRRLA
ncbi:MAG: hypothetical protein ABL986_01880 [Vicinamibacterales bacterium]